jgi:hypothetical protein
MDKHRSIGGAEPPAVRRRLAGPMAALAPSAMATFSPGTPSSAQIALAPSGVRPIPSS